MATLMRTASSTGSCFSRSRRARRVVEFLEERALQRRGHLGLRHVSSSMILHHTRAGRPESAIEQQSAPSRRGAANAQGQSTPASAIDGQRTSHHAHGSSRTSLVICPRARCTGDVRQAPAVLALTLRRLHILRCTRRSAAELTASTPRSTAAIASIVVLVSVAWRRCICETP